MFEPTVHSVFIHYMQPFIPYRSAKIDTKLIFLYKYIVNTSFPKKFY